MKAYKLGLIVGIMIVLVSCSTRKKHSDEPSNVKTFVFESGKSVYYGDIYNNGSNVFDVYLLDRGLGINQEGFITGTGYYLYLDLNTDNTSKEVPNNNYIAATTGTNYTFQKGSYPINTETLNRPEGSYLAQVKNGYAVEFYLLDNGTITITGTDSYTITSKNVISTDGFQLNFKYNGNLPLVDRITPMPERLTKGELWFFGDRYNVGINVFSINLGDEHTEMSELTGGGDMMQIEVYTPSSDIYTIPNGIYPVRLDTHAPNTVIDGYIQNNIHWGTWYFTQSNYQITQGSLNIQHKSGNLYTISFNFKDVNNTPIVRSAFDIELGYYDMTKVAPNAPKQMMRAKSSKTRNAEKTLPKINIKNRMGRSK